MEYTFEELKKQIISLDFSKTNKIKDLNVNDLKTYINNEIIVIKKTIEIEIKRLGNKKIEKIENLYLLEEPIKLNSDIIISTLQLNLLERIKIDLIKTNI